MYSVHIIITASSLETAFSFDSDGIDEKVCNLIKVSTYYRISEPVDRAKWTKIVKHNR